MPKCIVVGAGVAGLQCAKELQDNGFEVVVLEASFHIGGRVRTIPEEEISDLPKSHLPWIQIDTPTNVKRTMGSDHFGFDCGAEFYHAPDTLLTRCILDQGYKLHELFTWAHGDGGPSEKEAPDGGYGIYYLGNEEKLIKYDDKDPDLHHLYNTLWSLGERAETIDQFKTLREFLLDEGVKERVLNMADAGYANTVSGTLDLISAKIMARCEGRWNLNEDGDFRGEKPMGNIIISGLAKGLQIKRKHIVNKIDYQLNNMVTVTCSNNSSFHADCVVISVPIPVLQKNLISFNPPLHEDKINSIQSLKCEPGLKAVLKFTKKFWPDNLHGMICSDCYFPEIWFENFTSNDNQTLYYVTGFATSNNARRIGSHSKEVIVSEFLKQLDKIFSVAVAGEKFGITEDNQAFENYQGAMIVDWGKVPYIWGAYCCPAITEFQNARKIISQSVNDKVYFCGEGTDHLDFMTADAAMRTGSRAAQEVLLIHKERSKL